MISPIQSTTMAFLYLLTLLLLHSFSTEAEIINQCEGGNFTANSAFASNLDHLLADLSSSKSIFSMATKGASPDRVYGLVLCRGDEDPSFCTTCYQNLARNATQLCTYSTRATVWDRFCEIRYSDTRFFSTLDLPEVFNGFYNVQSSTEKFANMSMELSANVTYQAAFNSPLKFATGILSHSQGQIYALAQCTRDLSKDMCSQCLQQALQFYSNCCRLQIGGWFVGKSCNYRYEVYTFFKGDPTVVLTLPPSPPSTPTPTPPASLQQLKVGSLD